MLTYITVHMTSILFAIVLTFFVIDGASAQSFTGASTPLRSSGPVSSAVVDSIGHKGASPASVESVTELKYFDASRGTYDWVLGANYGGIIALIVGERMTLPWTNGYVDSISVVIDSLIGDSLTVILTPDTLYDVGNGAQFHLMDIFSQTNSYGEVVLHRADINVGGETIVRFDHAPVPQSFFVSVAADVNLTAGTIAPVWVRGDREAIRERTTESTRSGMVGIFNQNYYSLVLDSTFIVTGDVDVIFSNLYTKAFVTQDPSSVVVETTATTAVYPNPASDFIHVNNAAGSTVEIVDAIGRIMARRMITTPSEQLDIRGVPTGAYSLVVRSDRGVHSTTLSVVR
jgi:hypothetical protein